MQHVSMRKHVTKSFEDGEGKVRRRGLKREALADEAGEGGLMFEGVQAGQHPAGAVAQHEHRKIRFTPGREIDHAGDVGEVVSELRDVESLAIRSPASAQIHRVHRKAQFDQLLRHPAVIAAVRIESRDDDDEASRAAGGAPRTIGDRHSAQTRERRLFLDVSCCLTHRLFLPPAVIAGRIVTAVS